MPPRRYPISPRSTSHAAAATSHAAAATPHIDPIDIPCRRGDIPCRRGVNVDDAIDYVVTASASDAAAAKAGWDVVRTAVGNQLYSGNEADFVVEVVALTLDGVEQPFAIGAARDLHAKRGAKTAEHRGSGVARFKARRSSSIPPHVSEGDLIILYWPFPD